MRELSSHIGRTVCLALLLSGGGAMITMGAVHAAESGNVDTDVDDDDGLDVPSGKVADPDEIAPPDAHPRAHDAIPFPDAKPRDPDEGPFPDAKVPE